MAAAFSLQKAHTFFFGLRTGGLGIHKLRTSWESSDGRESEGRFVAEVTGRRGRGPGVVGCAATTTAASATPGEVATATAALPFDDLGCRVTHRRADLVDLDLVDRALLAFLGLV